ncbi:MAG: pantoate--beta-alanine ligase [Anaerolineae bacterium]|nr:pantoate--beta-alanine ligase [Anaerolineae bacterium]
MKIVETIRDLREARSGLSGQVGLVPTMGALHAGHIALVEQARAENDAVIVTIFVNPTQFGPHEDLSKYPRNLPRDLGLLEAAQVDLVFTPTPDLMYPPGYQTYVEVTQVSQGLEGGRRPGHFQGVATIVSKFFNLTQPTRAYFGQKDAQQVAVIRRMAYDLNFPLEVIVCPTVREPDGLAMSSRNVYLSPEERAAAPVIFRALQSAAAAYKLGVRRSDALRAVVVDTLLSESRIGVEYVAVTDAYTLREVEEAADSPLLLSLSVRLGTTRLIDNYLLPETFNTKAGLARVLGVAPHT